MAASARLTNGKALAGLALAVAGALVVSGALQAGVAALDPLETSDRSEGADRLQGLLEALPGMARAPRSVAVIGSSLTQHGFSPEQYEAALRARGEEAVAFNLGLPGADAQVLRALAERVCAEYQRAGTRAELTLLEVTPFQLTRARAAGATARELVDLKLSWLVTPEVLGRLASEPSRAAHVVALAAQGHHSSAVTAAVAASVLESSPTWWPVQSPDPLARRRALATQMRAEASPRAWDPATRGESRLRRPGTEALYAQWRGLRRDDEELRAELRWRIETADILGLDLDPAQVAQLEATATTLASCSRQLRLFIAPTNPRYVRRTEAGAQQLAALRAQLAAHGTPVVDLEAAGDFEPEEFVDVTHLEEERGRPHLSTRLAQGDLSPVGGR